jgi:phenylalanine-4-hydroxylase
MEKAIQSIPPHLRKYVVEQDYERYTLVDYFVWRFILRQLRAFLTVHAHEAYREGLEKTGIEIERIPHIRDISRKLEKFGWKAVPVSGFIPPAAFMEMQSLSLLPIASDMRTLDHLLYTPAPDIVHEAAGHAPILVQPEFAAYLKQYAQVAKKAILSREDLNLYEAIRQLSDVKENPTSTPEQIRQAEATLEQVTQNMSYVSEAAQLGRMNWWTAEYGLIGDLENPRIFGAGLLSSLGEARYCLKPQVKKIPLTVKCIEKSYDITEPQPQLYVTPDFKTLSRVLEELADQMAFRLGGTEGLNKAKQAKTVNTIELNSGLQISGELTDFQADAEGHIHFVRFRGPSQISYADKELPGHGTVYHSQGFSTPLGHIRGGARRCPSTYTEAEWLALGIHFNKRAHLYFESGFEVEGVVISWVIEKSKTLLLTFKDCTVRKGAHLYFQPDWGNFDMALGTSVPSVFGGAADRIAFGETEDFSVARVPVRRYSEQELKLHDLYLQVRNLREGNTRGPELNTRLCQINEMLDRDFPEEWLLRLEILELASQEPALRELKGRLMSVIESYIDQHPNKAALVRDGLTLIGVKNDR